MPPFVLPRDRVLPTLFSHNPYAISKFAHQKSRPAPTTTAEMDDHDTARHLIQGMEGKGRRQRSRELHSTLQQLQRGGAKMGERTYSVALQLLGRDGDTIRAQALYEEAVSKGVGETTGLITALMLSYAVIGDTTTVRRLWLRIENAMQTPTIATYTVAVSAHCNAGDEAGAMEVISDVCADPLTPGAEFVHHHPFTTPDVRFYATALYAPRTLHHTLTFFSKIPPSFKEAPVYNTLLAILCSHKEVDKAAEVIKEMQKKKFAVGRYVVQDYLELLAMQGRVEDLVKTLEGSGGDWEALWVGKNTLVTFVGFMQECHPGLYKDLLRGVSDEVRARLHGAERGEVWMVERDGGGGGDDDEDRPIQRRVSPPRPLPPPRSPLNAFRSGPMPGFGFA